VNKIIKEKFDMFTNDDNLHKSDTNIQKWLIIGKKLVLPLSVFLFVLLFIWVFLVDSIQPNVGFEAVLTHKPIFWGKEGLDPLPVKPGRTYIWFTTHYDMIYMQPRQHELNFEDMMTSDGVPISVHVAVRLKILDSVNLMKTFGSYWYENNVEAQVRNLVRQSIRKHGMNETAIDTKAIDDIKAEVFNGLKQYIASINIPILVDDIVVGKANPPDSIKDQRIATATQQQRKLTEEERRKAEDIRKGAELARAESDNAYRLKMNLSPEQFIALQNIEMQKEVCKGDNNCTFIINGGIPPVLQVK
jgi:regulator of protease activity HflC (stomatin/prohibitin superfamily)